MILEWFYFILVARIRPPPPEKKGGEGLSCKYGKLVSPQNESIWLDSFRLDEVVYIWGRLEYISPRQCTPSPSKEWTFLIDFQIYAEWAVDSCFAKY